MTASADLIVAGELVVTVDPDRRTIADGAVAVKDGTIVAVGPTADIDAAWTAARRIGGPGFAILPGFVDTHAHAGHALTKSLGADGAGWMATTGKIYARGADTDFWATEARLSAVDRLLCGTTTACLLMGGGPDVMRCEDERAADAHLAAVADLGLREVLAVGPSRPPWPAAFVDHDGPLPVERPVTPAEQIAVAARIAARWHGAAAGRIGVAISAPVFGTDEWTAETIAVTRDALTAARRHGLLFVQDGHRDGSIARLAAAVGGLEPDMLFGHSIDLTDADIAALTTGGARIAHNPTALMSVTGRCPAPELMDLGVVVGLGSDAPAPDRPFDMFRHMFQAMRLHARHFRDASVLRADRALEMATIEGARALGLGDRIGSIEPGKRADLVLVNVAAPHIGPSPVDVDRLVYFATGADIAFVVVDGRVTMEGRKIPGVDIADLLRRAALARERAIARIG